MLCDLIKSINKWIPAYLPPKMLFIGVLSKLCDEYSKQCYGGAWFNPNSNCSSFYELFLKYRFT